MLQTCYDPNNEYEIGVDEAGRGPLFGRLYVGAVILPKGNDFKHEWMKDSKKFHSKKKIREVAEYIKQNAIAWSVQYVDADIIDEINIRQAVFRGMHTAIKEIITNNTVNIEKEKAASPFLLIDGNDFKLYSVFDEDLQEIRNIPHVTIEGGDNKYTSIAAASILSKVARDTYIEDLCCKYPELVAKYGLDKNQGYGTKKHLDGILEHGITQWHRKTYGRCREAVVNEIIESI